MAKLAIVGSRHGCVYGLFKAKVQEWIQDHGRPEAIISGGAPGIDTMAMMYAKENNIAMVIYEAQWDRYGKAAGPIRNKIIVNEADYLLAFLSPDSKGTWNSIHLAQAKGIPCILHRL